MDTKTYHLKVTFMTPVLGTQPQKDVASEYIASKVSERNESSPPIPMAEGLAADELASLSEELERGTTAFHKRDGKPIFYDYQIKGFLKDAATVFNGKGGMPKNFRSKVDNLVFPKPRQIELHLPDSAEITFCERPLRAMTAQGPRTSLARSEELPAGTWFECDLRVYPGEIGEREIRELMSYGEDKGLGQWRNGGKGRIEFELDAK